MRRAGRSIEQFNYHNDSRHERGLSDFAQVDEDREIVLVEMEEGEEVEVPFSWKVCPTCGGSGEVESPAADVASQARHDAHAGVYAGDGSLTRDRTPLVTDCNECEGRRVVPRLDPRTERQQEAADQLETTVNKVQRTYQMQKMERAMGA